MLSCLATGTSVKDPQRRQSAKGKAYCTALMRVPAEDADAMLVSVIAFSEPAVAAILALKQGDSLAIAGRAKLTSWETGGEQRHGISMTADQLLTAYAAGQKRKAAREEIGGKR